MTLPAKAPPDTNAIALAREMADRAVPRQRFIAAINASGEEMVSACRRQGLALASVYRAVREYRAPALEEFDRLTAGSS